MPSDAPKTNLWNVTHGADPLAFEIYQRHYTDYCRKKKRKSNKFTGPGQSLVLVTDQYSALFVWMFNTVKRFDNQVGVNCAVFRNESNWLSSVLILQAESLAWERWPSQRLFTYVDADRIRSSNPGFCFKKAGWSHIGYSKVHKRMLFEKLPKEFINVR